MLRWRASLERAAIGGLFGLGMFLGELGLIWREGAVGLKIDVSGPLAALLAAARPQLPSMLFRVVIAYVAFGALAGLCAWVLAGVWQAGTPKSRWALWGVELVFILGALAWNRAVCRPALFDDLFPTALMRWLVDRGQPWHPMVATGIWLAVHLAYFLLSPGRWRAGRWVITGGAAALALFVGMRSQAGAESGPAGKKLVVLLGIDAFRPDRLGAVAGGREVAPHLDAFAADATTFSTAYTPIAQTQPAWRSLLTARWPQRTGVRYPLTPAAHWQKGLPTFAQAMTRAGYRTAFWTDCSRFNYQGPAAGFTERHEPPRGAVNFLLEKLRFRGLGMWADNALGAALLPEFVDNRALAGIHDPIGYARRLARAMGSMAEEGPTLFAYHATAAHFPGDPVYPFYRKYLPPTEPLERRLRMAFSPITSGDQGSGSREAAEGLYDELLSQADAQMGIILDELKARGLYEGAWVIVFSDHGESFHADTPELEGATPVHGARLSEEENHIVLMVKPPSGFSKVPQVDALVRLIDLGPTILDAAGLPPLPDADGKSLLPLIQGQSAPARLLYAETGFTHAAPDAFDPEHLAQAPRSFDAYQVHPDGAIEMTEAAHQAILKEKDVGAFDGKNWLIRSPRKDGTIARSCRGDCDDGSLERWLRSVEPAT